MLLIPTFLLLIFPANLTIYLRKNTKHSATIFTIHSFGKIYLWTLAYDLGFFPFDIRPSCLMSVCFLLINFINSLTKFKEVRKPPLD